jgi:hypothetical protein
LQRYKYHIEPAILSKLLIPENQEALQGFYNNGTHDIPRKTVDNAGTHQVMWALAPVQPSQNIPPTSTGPAPMAPCRFISHGGCPYHLFTILFIGIARHKWTNLPKTDPKAIPIKIMLV